MKDIRELIGSKEKELAIVRRDLAILKEALRILREPGDAEETPAPTATEAASPAA